SFLALLVENDLKTDLSRDVVDDHTLGSTVSGSDHRPILREPRFCRLDGLEEVVATADDWDYSQPRNLLGKIVTSLLPTQSVKKVEFLTLHPIVPADSIPPPLAVVVSRPEELGQLIPVSVSPSGETVVVTLGSDDPPPRLGTKKLPVLPDNDTRVSTINLFCDDRVTVKPVGFTPRNKLESAHSCFSLSVTRQGNRIATRFPLR